MSRVTKIFSLPAIARRAIESMRGRLFAVVVALVFVDALDLTLPLILKTGIDRASQTGIAAGVAAAAFGYLAISSAQSALRFFYRTTLPRIAFTANHAIRADLMRAILLRERGRRACPSSGELASLLTSDAEAATAPIDPGIVIVTDALFYLATVPVLLLVIGGTLTIAPMLALLTVPLILTAAGKRIRAASADAQAALADISSAVQERIEGIAVIRSFAAEEGFAAHYSALCDRYHAKAVALARIEAITPAALQGSASFATALTLLLGGAQVISGQLTIGSLVALDRYVRQLMWPLQAVGIWISLRERSEASSERISAVPEAPAIRENSAAVAAGTVSIQSLTVMDEAGKKILSDFSFAAAPGEHICIVGPNGSGKSLLLGALLKFVPVKRGMIALGGQDIIDCDASAWRAQFAWVPQEPALLPRTIAENIAFGGDYSIDQIEQACEKVGLLAELARFPLGLHSIIGAAGVRVSGGQRQRIAIARALLRNPAVILLDDPFSALDSVAERRILDLLQRDFRKTTVIYTGHRHAAVVAADRVAVLMHGTLADSGSVAEIQSRNAWFREFIERQRLMEEIDGVQTHV